MYGWVWCCLLQNVRPNNDSALGRTRTGTGHRERPDDDSNLSHMRTATRHRERQDNDSDLGRTRTATGHRKHSSSQAATQREEQLAAERLRHNYSFLYCFYIIATCIFPGTSYSLLHVYSHFSRTPSLFIIHLPNSEVAAWLRCKACVFTYCVCLV